MTVGERIMWRVPVLLAYPDSGPVGQAGTLEMDVETGAVLGNQEQLTAIADYALFLAERSAAVLSDAPQRSKRVFGSARGQLQIMPDFDEPLPEFQKYQ